MILIGLSAGGCSFSRGSDAFAKMNVSDNEVTGTLKHGEPVPTESDLAFARNEPAYYSAMFEAGLPLEIYPELQQAGERAFAILRNASEALTAKLPKASRPPALMMALHIWALSHGVASLFGRGDAARRKLPMSPEDLLEAGVLVYLRGLGLDGR